MTGAERTLGRPERSRIGVPDGRAWLRLGLAVAGLAALAISGLIGAQSDPRTGDHGPRQVVPAEENGYGRWASPGPRWRSRSQILEDAGILKRR